MRQIQELIFDTPWWLLGALGLVGIALLVSGNARLEKRLKYAGLAVLGLGALLAAVSYLVDTEREKVQKQTVRLVRSAEQRDRQTMASLLHPAISLSSWSREEILDAARMYADDYGLKSITVNSMEFEVHKGVIIVTLSAITHHEFSSRMPISVLPSTWQFDWYETEQGWLLKNITILKIANSDRVRLDERLAQPPR